MVAGADSIDDMALQRHGGMGKIFTGAYAPSTLGSFLRSFTFDHVRQLDAVSARFRSGLVATTPVVAGIDDQVMVDIETRSSRSTTGAQVSVTVQLDPRV